jgi:hypothetical protein
MIQALRSFPNLLEADLLYNIELLRSDEAILLLIYFDRLCKHLRLVGIPLLSLVTELLMLHQDYLMKPALPDL